MIFSYFYCLVISLSCLVWVGVWKIFVGVGVHLLCSFFYLIGTENTWNDGQYYVQFGDGRVLKNQLWDDYLVDDYFAESQSS